MIFRLSHVSEYCTHLTIFGYHLALSLTCFSVDTSKVEVGGACLAVSQYRTSGRLQGR